MKGGTLTVCFDGDCGICSDMAGALRRLDRDGRLQLVPLQRASEVPMLRTAGWTSADLAADLHVFEADGSWATGGEAVLRICAALPPLRPLAAIGRLPLIGRLIGPVYGLVARNRHAISRAIGAAACRLPHRSA